MNAYDSLSTFPDVAPALLAVAHDPSISAVVFSNGTNNMVTNSVTKSAGLAPHASIFEHLVTVEETMAFKPAPQVYYHLAQKVGKTTSKADLSTIWLVSGNPFDIVGARTVGLQAIWVDRVGKGWTDKLGMEPTDVVRSLEEVVDVVRKYSQKS
jgi:2-haloacid dehalogenase